jgi:hypothetical protein
MVEQKETCLVLLVYAIHAKINFKKILNSLKVKYTKRSSIILPFMHFLYICNELSNSAQHIGASHGNTEHLQQTSEQLELATCCSIHKGGSTTAQTTLVRLHLSKLGQHAAKKKSFKL